MTKAAPVSPRRARRQRSRLAELLDALAVREGTHPTAVPGVQLTRQSYPTSRRPIIYQPNVVVIGQGRKRGYLGDEVFPYGPDDYLALSVPLPAECEVEASADEPLLGVTVAVEPAMLGEMLIDLDE